MKSNVLVSAALAAAMLAAGAAHAASQDPSTGDGNLMFFVTDQSKGITYTDVLTQDVNSYFSSAAANTPAPTTGSINTINGDQGFSVNLSSDANLATFLSTAGSDTLAYGIIGGTFTTTGSAAKGIGAARFVSTDANANDQLTVPVTSVYGPLVSSLQTDISALNFNLNGANSVATTGVFGTTAMANGSTLSSVYGTPINMLGTAPGSSVTLYGVTGNGAKVGNGDAYSLGTATFTLGTDLLTFAGNGAAVPLPAALWLFGSGLLGLAGIRRRASSAA